MFFRDIPVLNYEINFPYFTTTCCMVVAEQINDYYAQAAKSTEEYCRNILYQQALERARYIQDGRPFHSYSLNVDFQITYNSGCITSLYMETYTYAGGAHGDTKRTSDTWNFKTGERLLLYDLFPRNTNYMQRLQNRIAYEISQRLLVNPGSYFADYQSLLQKNFNPENYYLIPDGFVIYYQFYDITPHYSGIPEFRFYKFPILTVE